MTQQTDPETHSKVNNLISKKFQVSHFRDVPEFFQKKEEIVLQLPIEEIQFQQFCKLLNTRRIISMQRSSRKRNIWQVEIKF